MSLPYILVVDDQYARDDAERWNFVRDANLAVMQAEQEIIIGRDEAVAQVAFCSGQRRDKDVIINDYDVIRDAVEARDDWALVLLDVRFDSGPLQNGVFPTGQPDDGSFGEVVSRQLAEDFPDLPVVMLTGMHQEELDDRRIDYLSKEGLDEHELKGSLLKYGRLSSEQTRHLLGLGNDIVAQSEQTVSVFREAFIHAEENDSIMILGESGSGKEILANYIHRVSGRSGPFIAINVASLPSNLIESELFGHERGAFTGAHKMRIGKFEQADKGTLFLDEIGDMPHDTQVKILRVLQEREVMQVGGNKPRSLDVRLITATFKDLSLMVEEGDFRNDLYGRINVTPLKMSPLRERSEDILPLAEVFLEKIMSDSGKIGIKLSSEAKSSLRRHSYPRNVRELENLMKHIISGTGNNRVISSDEIMAALGSSHAVSLPNSSQQSAEDLRQHQTAQPPGVPLGELPALLLAAQIDMNDPALAGVKPRLEDAFKELLQRLAGAALERCRDPVTGKFNPQGAMRLLKGDSDLKTSDPKRMINKILGRNGKAYITDEVLEWLVKKWRGKNSRIE